MAHRFTRQKQVFRFTVVDDGIKNWAVRDTKTGELVREGLNDPSQARSIAEELNENALNTETEE